METLSQIIPGISLTTAIAVIAVCFFAAIMGGTSGAGSGLLITLFITPIVGPKAVIPMISVLMMINNASRVWMFRRDLQPKHVALIAGTAIPTSALGALLFVRLDSDVVQAVLGTILIASVPLRRLIEGQKIATSTPAIIAVSGIYGFLSSLIVGAGMLIIPILLGFGLAGPTLLATDAAISALVNLAKIFFFGTLDALSPGLFLVAFVMGLCTIPGTWVAAWIVRRTEVRIHTFAIETLIVIGGAALIYGSAF